VRLLSWIIMVPVAVLVIVFSVSNRTSTPVDFWPLPYSVTLPLFSVVLGSLLVGFCLGGLVGWISNWGRRREARRQSRELAVARRELEMVREREEAAGGAGEVDPRVRALPPISPDLG
jgi:putative membrane protein